jgi:hypothetical protein
MARATRSSRRKPVVPVSETSLHYAVADFLRLAWPPELPWVHVPMGENRGDKITRTGKDGRAYTYSPSGAKLKRMGARPGWADLTFILPNGQAAFIELKSHDGVLSDEQADFAIEVRALKCGYQICRSLEEVEATLTRWLSLMDPPAALRPTSLSRAA